ncbi:hypothetical protein F5Y11DRAFT_360735 [Daldinia sp. FL1419]|nr:hypothetical protein F5Y11DRAFT_360735 [Daldinia sp. FL1419]
MDQKRIHEHPHLSYRYTKTFLHLPPSVRRQVYEEAGLIVGGNINRTKQDEAYRLIYNILQTCRAIHDEVQRIIYAENRFVVNREGTLEDGFYHLGRLSPQACSALRNLYVHLHVEGQPRVYCPPTATLRPSWIKAWQTTLNLYLICDTGNDKKTRAVLRPLHDNPGILADCHIRLDEERYSLLCAVAQDVALRAKGIDPGLRKKPFRFMDLPQELCLRILKYTDLVAPRNEIEWTPELGFHTTSSYIWKSCCNEESDDYIDKLFDHENHFLDCEPEHVDTTGSFCSACHSSYSSSCQCWIPPDSLMRVSRRMYAYAIDILYSCNRVILFSDPYAHASNLVQKDVIRRPEVLSHLRSVELVFPGFSPDLFLRPEDPTYADWKFAVDHLRAYANLNAMTLVESSLVLDNREPFSRFLSVCGSAFLAPLTTLRDGGLNRLFVFLEWDWHYKYLDELEVRLEKEVMGSDYDSCVVGKMEEYPSQWMLIGVK